MRIGMIGLGKMGMNMARRLLKNGIEVVAYNRTTQKVDEIVKKGAIGAYSVIELVEKLSCPRVIWIMLPAGRPVDMMIDELNGILNKNDVIVEGGNSFYKDDIKRYNLLKQNGIHYIDVGVSGGIWGLEIGYCLMIGGDKDIYHQLIPIFEALAPKDGYLYCGPAGAGHFVKMIHNGIEYGMMSAYGEGFALLAGSIYKEHLNLAEIAHLWNQGSVIRSWLLELAENALKDDEKLENIEGFVEDSGEGRWTIQEAIEKAIPAPVLTAALYQRFRSRIKDSFSDKLLAALRNQFGGHAVTKKGES